MKIILPAAKSFVIFFMLLIFSPSTEIYSQACYNPYVEYIISQSVLDSVLLYNRELTGEQLTFISGQQALIYSRVSNSPANELAAQYIFEKFAGWGLQTRYQVYSSSGKNIIAVKPGSKYPGRQYIIGAHYDNSVNGLPIDTTYGADDNASGVCGVLEAARLLRNYTFDYTIIFVAFDEEENGLLGSFSYADTAYTGGDTVLGYLNLDMLGFDSNNDNVMTVGTDTNSLHLANIVYSACKIYQPHLKPKMDWSGGGSDHYAFWFYGFKAAFMIEDYRDYNSGYHTIGDNYALLNKPYFHSNVKTAIAALIVLLKDFVIDIKHKPLASTADTTSRIAEVVISSVHKIAQGTNRPRLYYKTGSSLFSYVNAFYNNQDTFRFLIPGTSAGSYVSYYIAAQDSAQTISCTLPQGGMGISPPGSVPPAELFTYYILEASDYCSNILPKPIAPRKIVYDSIYISLDKIIHDVDIKVTINHVRDEDLYINLVRAGQSQTDLSSNNGGSGSNYINTVFDDESEISITEGTPPFTGRYRPEALLSKYDGMLSSGYWILKILNMSETDTAQLVEWCIDISHYNPIGITSNQIPVRYELSQNYPNPFNAQTKIDYSIPKAGHVFIAVYDVLGREVKLLVNEQKQQGNYSVMFNAENLPSGVYFYRIIAGDVSTGSAYTEAKKMIMVK